MAKSAVLTWQTTSPHRGTEETLVQISDPQRSAPCTLSSVYHSPDQENVAHETQFCNQLSRKHKIICLSVTIAVVLVVIVVLSIFLTSYKADQGRAAANGEDELDSKVLRSEFPGTGMTSVPTTTSYYGDGDLANCSLVFIFKKSKVFNDSQSYCKTHNSRLLQEKDVKTVFHCIPEREDFWAKKSDDSDPDRCYIYNTEHGFVNLDCSTGRRCICVKDPNTTKKNEET